jgi:hypothetical protein
MSHETPVRFVCGMPLSVQLALALMSHVVAPWYVITAVLLPEAMVVVPESGVYRHVVPLINSLLVVVVTTPNSDVPTRPVPFHVLGGDIDPKLSVPVYEPE